MAKFNPSAVFEYVVDKVNVELILCEVCSNKLSSILRVSEHYVTGMAPNDSVRSDSLFGNRPGASGGIENLALCVSSKLVVLKKCIDLVRIKHSGYDTALCGYAILNGIISSCPTVVDDSICNLCRKHRGIKVYLISLVVKYEVEVAVIVRGPYEVGEIDCLRLNLTPENVDILEVIRCSFGLSSVLTHRFNVTDGFPIVVGVNNVNSDLYIVLTNAGYNKVLFRSENLVLNYVNKVFGNLNEGFCVELNASILLVGLGLRLLGSHISLNLFNVKLCCVNVPVEGNCAFGRTVSELVVTVRDSVGCGYLVLTYCGSTEYAIIRVGNLNDILVFLRNLRNLYLVIGVINVE